MNAKRGEPRPWMFSISLWCLGLAVILGFCGRFRTDWRIIVGQGKNFA